MYARTLYIGALVSSCVCIHILTHLYAYSNEIRSITLVVYRDSNDF